MKTAPSFRGCLTGIAVVVALLLVATFVLAMLMLLTYGEEDWRGARQFAQAREEFEAAGGSIDPAKAIPPPVPEVENFGALPFFHEVIDPTSQPEKPYYRTEIGLTFRKEMGESLPNSKTDEKPDGLPYLGNFDKGEEPDRAEIQKKLEAFLHHSQPEAKIPESAKPLKVFSLICPVVGELRAANATYPLCRFEKDYGPPCPWKTNFGGTTDGIKIAQVLTYDARLALLSGEPEVALDDFRVACKIYSGVQKEPLLINGLVSAAVVAIPLAMVHQGLSQRVWNDSQVAELDAELDSIDFLTDFHTCFQGELSRFSLPLLDYYAANRPFWRKQTEQLYAMFDDEPGGWKEFAFELTYQVVPNGWFDAGKAWAVRQRQARLKIIDVPSRRVYPDREKDAAVLPRDPAVRWMDFILPDIDLVYPAKNFSYQQVQLDEARIACRLERYRLAHGGYSPTLDALVPDYGALPHDIFNGQPYNYHLNPENAYLIYSVGWDQKDDGGAYGDRRSKESPDWIWTNYPTDVAKK